MNELEKRVFEMDKEMIELEKEIKNFEKNLKNIKKMYARIEKLEKYYYGDWASDHEKWKNLNYGILSEDWLWNLLHDEMEIKKDYLKFLIKKI